MSDVAALIADMVRAGVDPDLIGRTAAALAGREAVTVRDEQAERRRERDRERKRLRNSAESAERPEQKVSPTPPSKIQPSSPPKGGSSPFDLEPFAKLIRLTVEGLQVDEALSGWNAVAEACGLPKAKSLTKQRRAAIRARLSENGPDRWRDALLAVQRSRFCRGENDRGFRADLDFVCQPKSFQRLIEGFYGEDAEPVTPQPRAAEPDPWAFRLEVWNRDRSWREAWGPPPGKPGCRAPLDHQEAA